MWPYFECKDEYCVSGTLKECGEHVKRLSFPINMPSAKLVWLTENCVNVTELSLPPRVYFHPSQLERIVCTMTHLEKLDICWSENIKPLLEICTDLKELIIRLKKFKTDQPASTWEFKEWVNEGIRFPPVVKIFTKNENFMMDDLYRFFSKHYTILPASAFTVVQEYPWMFIHSYHY